MSHYRVNKFSQDCQLVAVVNARAFVRCKMGWENGLFTGKMADREYDALATLTGCHSGTAISVENLFPYFQLGYKNHKFNKRWIRNNLPVQLSVRVPERNGPGWFHSILIISATKQGVVVANYSPAQNIDQKQLTWKELESIYNEVPPHVRACRAFFHKRYKI